jgi:uncharacterized protein HemY
MKCPHCQYTIHQSDRYCGRCGTKLSGAHRRKEGDETLTTIDSAFIKLRLGIVYFKEEKYREALNMFRASLQLKPENEEIAGWIQKTEKILQNPAASP